MTDLEYLLNCQLNPLQEMELKQILTKIVDIQEEIKRNQSIFSKHTFCLASVVNS